MSVLIAAATTVVYVIDFHHRCRSVKPVGHRVWSLRVRWVFAGFASPRLFGRWWAGGFTELRRGSGKCWATTGMTFLLLLLQRACSSHLAILAFLFCVAHLFQPFHRKVFYILLLLPFFPHLLICSVSVRFSRLDQVTVWLVLLCLSVRSKYPFLFLSVHLPPFLSL